jgi:aldehyde dehydrogenase (NAD+)
MVQTYKIYINGEWVDSESGETFTKVNPANPDEVIGEFQKGNENDVKKAIDAAENAFEKWSEMPAPKRGEILFKIGEMLKQSKEDLARLMTWEMGKVLMEARGDVQEAIDMAYYMAAEGRRLFGHTTTSELKDKFAMTVRRPIGIAGLITPWNFPIAIPSWKIMPALICGNTIVFKPSSDTPLCAIKLVEILEKAGIPKGVVNLVTGPGGSVGMSIVRNEKVRVISFTGHRDTGAEILKEAGIKKVSLELGGKNPIIIMDDADLDLAVDGVIWGGFGTTGQRCTAASRVVIHEKVKEKFEKMMVERIKKLRLGNGLDEKTDIGPLVNRAAQDKSRDYVEIGLKEGGKLLIGGHVPNMKGFFFEPTLFTDCFMNMRIAQEEIFGPVVTIISAKDLNEAIKLANSVEYGLSTSIYTKDIRNAFKAIEKLEAGLTYVNSSTIGSEVHLPFGGVKHTGNTREGGILGIDEFSEIKTVYVDYSGKLQKAQIDIE